MLFHAFFTDVFAIAYANAFPSLLSFTVLFPLHPWRSLWSWMLGALFYILRRSEDSDAAEGTEKCGCEHAAVM